MADVTSIVNGVTRFTLLIMSLLLLGWAFYPDFRPEFLGGIAGSVVGLSNVRFLAFKVVQVSQLALQLDGQRRKMSLGFVTRICLVLLVVMAGIKFEQIALWSALAGAFGIQLLTMPVSIVLSLRNKK